MKFLLHHGANPNIQNNEGFTPLFISFLVLYDKSGNVISVPNDYLIEFLLDAGADPNLVTKNGLTILEEIKNKVNKDANIPSNIKEILKKIEKQKPKMASDNNVSMAPEVSNVLSDDEYNKSIQNIHTLYDEYDNALKDDTRVNENDKDLIAIKKLFKEEFNKLINRQYDEGKTLLHYASFIGDFDNATFLIDRGADLTIKDKDGLMPINIAFKNKKFAIANYLLMNLDKSVKDNIKIEDVKISLVYAVENCWLAIADMLIDKTTKDINSQDDVGNTPLHYAIFFKAILFVDKLLKKGANPNIKNNAGNTPLFLSFSYLKHEPDPSIIYLLLKAGADPNLLKKKIVTKLEKIKNRGDNNSEKYDDITEIKKEIKNQNNETPVTNEKSGGRKKSKRNKKLSKKQKKSKKQNSKKQKIKWI